MFLAIESPVGRRRVRREEAGGGKKESTASADAVNVTEGRSPVGGVKQAVDARESRREAVRAASKRKPKNFIDMPDEL